MYIYSKILLRHLGALGLTLCMLAWKNLQKTEVATIWRLAIAAPEPLRPRDGSKSALRGIKTAPSPRVLQEASRRPQERSGKPQDGSKSSPGGSETAPRALREASRRPKSAPGYLKTAQERSRRLQDVFKSTPEGSKRPKSALGDFKTTKPRRSC